MYLKIQDFIENPQTTIALTFLTHIISAIGGVGMSNILGGREKDFLILKKKNIVRSPQPKSYLLLLILSILNLEQTVL